MAGAAFLRAAVSGMDTSGISEGILAQQPDRRRSFTAKLRRALRREKLYRQGRQGFHNETNTRRSLSNRAKGMQVAPWSRVLIIVNPLRPLRPLRPSR